MQRSAEALARGELIGLDARVANATDAGRSAVEGRVIDETRHTLTIQTTTGATIVPKHGATFQFTTGHEPVMIPGDAIAHRPEDRIKKARLRQ